MNPTLAEEKELAGELHRYCERQGVLPGGLPRFPLDDEPFVESWRQYADEVNETGSIEVIRQYFPQLQFPITAGISQTADYLSAVRNGKWPTEPSGFELHDPHECRILLHPSPAGTVPVIVVADRRDFGGAAD